ncbi:MAG: signal recognition particle-docking protein FtsY [Gemmatimonadetes bacterium]|nr:signal recognition particle-docking protein FtsY [Gemmatimonadota bacterium]
MDSPPEDRSQVAAGTQAKGAAPSPHLVNKPGFWSRLKRLALTDVKVIAKGGVDRRSLEQLEELLLASDFGVSVTERLVDAVRRRGERGEVKTGEDFERALAEAVAEAVSHPAGGGALARASDGPTVVLVLGVNGAGKTTFIGKLAARLKNEGKKVLVAAGDTFRAGAIDQLRVWAERSGAEFVGASPGADPGAIAWAAIDAAVARGADIALIDTAGRLHTSDALMEELRKVVRVIAKRLPGAPHEALLVLDATIGQNAVAQARTFAASVPLTGLVLNKLDGTAKGGVVVAVREAIGVPVRFVGIGEGAADLEPFDARAFADGLFSA